MLSQNSITLLCLLRSIYKKRDSRLHYWCCEVFTQLRNYWSGSALLNLGDQMKLSSFSVIKYVCRDSTRGRQNIHHFSLGWACKRRNCKWRQGSHVLKVCKTSNDKEIEMISAGFSWVFFFPFFSKAVPRVLIKFFLFDSIDFTDISLFYWLFSFGSFLLFTFFICLLFSLSISLSFSVYLSLSLYLLF